MKYTTTYDIGKRKRETDGINEDSVAVTLLQDGHREGATIPESEFSASDDRDRGTSGSANGGESDMTVSGPGDEPDTEPGAEDAADDDASDRQQAGESTLTSETGVDVNEETTEVYPDDGSMSVASDPPDNAGPADRHAGIFVLADGAGGEEAGDVASYIATTVITEHLSEFVHRARRLDVGGFGLEIDPEALGKAYPDEESEDGDVETDDTNQDPSTETTDEDDRTDTPAFDPVSGPSDADVEAAITEAVEAAHRAIVRYANEIGLGGTYTTVVVGVYLDDKLHYGWVGDSRAYVVNEHHGEISLLTKDHAKVERYVDEGKVDPVEAHVHPEGNQITRAVGGDGRMDPETATIEVDTKTIELFRDDIVVITSDGLIDAQTDHRRLYQEYVRSGRDDDVAERVIEAVVTDADIRDIVLEEPTLDAAAERLVAFSNEKGGKDNVSLIIFSGSTLNPSPASADELPDRAYGVEDLETRIK